MGAATAELVRLIDLSLGAQPSGVINFNYLHTLMHAIVRRLGTMEHVQSAYPAGTGVGGGEIMDERGSSGGVGGETSTPAAGEPASGGDDGTDGVPIEKSEREKLAGEGDGIGTGASTGIESVEQTKKESSQSSPHPPHPTSDPVDSKFSSSGRTSRAGVQGSEDVAYRPKSSFVTAANDLGAMERKLQELESRLNVMDTLPELLERKSSDMGATPIKDRWNYTNLSKRLSAAEDGLEQVR